MSSSPPPHLTAWLMSWGNRPSGAVVLVLLAVLEATTFPAPTEAMLVLLCVSQPKRAWWFAALAAAGSLTGGLIGYHLGAFTFAEVGVPVLQWLGVHGHLAAVESAYRDNTWVALMTSGYTPIPYMLYTMAAGAFAVPLETFAVGSLVGRALKYVPLAVLAWYLGPAVHRVAARYAAWAGLVITGVLVATLVVRML